MTGSSSLLATFLPFATFVTPAGARNGSRGRPRGFCRLGTRMFCGVPSNIAFGSWMGIGAIFSAAPAGARPDRRPRNRSAWTACTGRSVVMAPLSSIRARIGLSRPAGRRRRQADEDLALDEPGLDPGALPAQVRDLLRGQDHERGREGFRDGGGRLQA